MKMKLDILLGLLSVTMVMGKIAELPDLTKMAKMAEDSKEQRAVAERMDEEDAMEKRKEKSTTKNSLLATEARENVDVNVNVDMEPMEAFLNRLDDRITVLEKGKRKMENGTGDGTGTCGQFFVIYKLANAEEAKEMCESKGAQLANVGAGTEYEKDSFDESMSWNESKWSPERKVLKTYLTLQFDLMESFKSEKFSHVWLNWYWVGMHRLMYISKMDWMFGSVSGQILKMIGKGRGLPVCQIAQTF